jgi:hypothetical protein
MSLKETIIAYLSGKKPAQYPALKITVLSVEPFKISQDGCHSLTVSNFFNPDDLVTESSLKTHSEVEITDWELALSKHANTQGVGIDLVVKNYQILKNSKKAKAKKSELPSLTEIDEIK